jgi:hypothetical protein
MNIGEHEEANFCDNLVTILAGNRPILAYIGALACGCNSLKMLVDVAKCELALDGSTGLRTKRSHVRVVPGASSKSIIYGHLTMPAFILLPQTLPKLAPRF